MTATIWSAALFLPFVLPICLWVCYTDLSRMKIRNVAVLALLAVFAIVGLLALPFETYLWRWAAAGIVFAVGILLYMIGGIGAGDIKFMAAMAPFFDHGDLAKVMYLFAGVLLAAFVTHRVARNVPKIRALTPDWVSWESNRFPMGLALAGTLAFYLIGALILGSPR